MKKFSMLPRKKWLLAGILVVSVLLRVGSAIYMGDTVQDLPGIFDQISYDRLAQNVAAGRGFSFDVDWWPATRAGEPTAHWSYLMTVYLAGVYTFFGHHPLIARLLQAVISGLLLPLITYRLGSRIGNHWTGLVAALVSAIYIYFFYYAGALMTETFFILAVLACLNISLDLIEKPGWRTAAALGAAVGCAILLRQLFLLFFPFLLVWLVRVGRSQLRLRYLAMVVLVPIVMILPWTIRNYLAFDQFVLLNTNAGYAFYWANHPIHGTNFISILPPEYPSYKELIPAELLRLDEASLDKALLRLGLKFVLENPGRYALLSLSRVKDYFLFWPKASSGLISNISRVGSFGLFLPFMLYGLILSLIPKHREGVTGKNRENQPAFNLLYLFILVYSGVHLLSWSYVRYRLPVDAVLIIFAAIGLQSSFAWIKRKKIFVVRGFARI